MQVSHHIIITLKVQVSHYNYAGDSILGYKSHLGAGAITSNLKSDGTLVNVKYGTEKIKLRRACLHLLSFIY